MEIQYASVWEKNADAIPNEIALICGDNEVSWKDFVTLLLIVINIKQN